MTLFPSGVKGEVCGKTRHEVLISFADAFFPNTREGCLSSPELRTPPQAHQSPYGGNPAPTDLLSLLAQQLPWTGTRGRGALARLNAGAHPQPYQNRHQQNLKTVRSPNRGQLAVFDFKTPNSLVFAEFYLRLIG